MNAPTRNSAKSARGLTALFALPALASSLLAAPVHAADPVATLMGSWSGNGRLYYTDGRNESIHCTAHYTGGGSELRMAIRCQSDTNPIHMRSKLKIEGGRANGDWEERTFNASGTASGKVTDSAVNLAVSGGGFNGTMNVSYTRSEHSVNITAQGIGMSRVSLNFRRQ